MGNPKVWVLLTLACFTSCLVPVIVTLPFAPGPGDFSLEQLTLAPVVLVINFKLSPPRPTGQPQPHRYAHFG